MDDARPQASSALNESGCYGRSRFRVGDPLPAVLTTQELGAIIGVGANRASVLQKDGAFAIFELLPRLGSRPRYSGKKVQQWLDGELAPSSTATYGGPLRRRWPGAR